MSTDTETYKLNMIRSASNIIHSILQKKYNAALYEPNTVMEYVTIGSIISLMKGSTPIDIYVSVMDTECFLSFKYDMQIPEEREENAYFRYSKAMNRLSCDLSNPECFNILADQIDTMIARL